MTKSRKDKTMKRATASVNDLLLWGAGNKFMRHLLSPRQVSLLESAKGWTWKLTEKEAAAFAKLSNETREFLYFQIAVQAGRPSRTRQG
jgi:hypothetical protein